MALLVAIPACSSDKGGAGGAAEADDGDFVLTFEPAATADAHIAQLVKDSGVAKDAVDGLNEQYALPQDVSVTFSTADPDESGPNFDPETNVIAIPYSSLTADRELFRTHGYDTDEDADDAVLGDVLFTLYHELGHALIANYELPVTGKEEDAVDGLSAVILSETYEDGQSIVVTAADWFSALVDQQGTDHEFSDYADVHSLDEQRFVTLLCLAYGSNPNGYSGLVGDDVLPADRADGCEAEYSQARDSWTTLLEPWDKTA
jgi:hypothetical protein